MFKYLRSIVLLSLITLPALAQTTETTKTPHKKHKHRLYASWGYNTEWYTHSTVSVSQPSLGSDYQLLNVKAHDHKGWDKGLFSQALTIPQYNYRIGYMFDDEKGWGIELNFDHTKYIIADPQIIKLKGSLKDQEVPATINFTASNGFYYYLNNGANFFLINIVKRWHLLRDKKQIVQLDGIGKFGVGPVVPHVQNSFFGDANVGHFQLGGWNTGVEGVLRATFFKYAYVEYCNKLDYARYSGLRIYKGTAKQAFGTYEMIVNVGATIPIGRK